MALEPGRYTLEASSAKARDKIKRAMDVEAGKTTIWEIDVKKPKKTNNVKMEGPPEPEPAPVEQATSDQPAPLSAATTPATPLEPTEPPQSTEPATAPEVAEAEPPSPAATTGRLTVKVTPADASIKILNIRPRFQQNMELEPGLYDLEASRDGLGSERAKVQIEAGRTTVWEVNLKEPGEAAARLSPKQDKGTSQSHLEQALEAKKAKRLDEAIEAVNKAIAHDSRNAAAYKIRGVCP